ncbi:MULTISPECIES: beta propeller repeat protein, partial [Paenibacillus]|jgi:hypothetical protein|uniref:hypothetical protein n=1 Tax=Paenibacillus TaxID=44249 RepID=UPI0004B49752
MKFKFPSAMNNKKKLGTLLVCGALVASLGAVSASASNSFTTLLVKSEDGARWYSEDDGKTWSQEAPNGVNETIDADGKVTISRGTAPVEGDRQGPTEGVFTHRGGVKLLVKTENGKKLYSVDGGKTWSNQAPQ